ncbi:MAG: 1-acyl-sn-glycerol-3-phosphate acyltransferase [Clostridia bacterium]|nr:1-acyl-sn-glycerol-3-phosphate acyltransferase [Clostridia bacterium]
MKERTAVDPKKEKAPARQWVLKRHSIIYKLAYPVIKALCRILYPGLEIVPFPEGRTGQYIYLYNHQTPLDQFFISIINGKPVYHIATEDIMSNGWVSRLLAWTVAPIPILKQMKDTRAVKNCITVVKQGGSIAVAPEGNRTFSGRTTNFNIGIVKLIKLLKLPAAVLRIEGGYGVEPRWAGNRRRGKIKAYVSEVITPEEYSAMDTEEFFERLKTSLWVDESVPGGEYLSKAPAEYLERLFYVCPDCGFSAFESKGGTVSCSGCGRSFRYTEHKELIDLSGKRVFDSIGGWYDYQEAFVNSMDPEDHLDEPLFRDAGLALYTVRLYDRKVPVADGVTALLFGDRVEIVGADGETIETILFDETDTITVLGKKKLNIYNGGRVIQIAGGDRFNALKYVNLYYRFKNAQAEKNGGTEGVKFLGL